VLDHRPGGGLVLETEGLVVEALAVELEEIGGEGGRRRGLELGRDRPVLLPLEGTDLALALRDEADRHRLHPTGRETAPHLLPEERADLIADQAVEDPPGDLGVELVGIELLGVLDRRLHRLLGDLVEEDAVDVPPTPEALGDVPGDRLPLPVGIGREVDVVGVLGRPLELLDHLPLAVNDVVLGLEIALDVHPELRLGQVDDVSDRGLHREAAPQVLAQGPRLRGRLYDDQVLRHALLRSAARRRRMTLSLTGMQPARQI
jgi:hypothetical protein